MASLKPFESGDPRLSADLCRAQMERIIQSPDFDGTEREGRFLRYVVEQTVTGHSGRIKAYSIAIEVFGRKETFDAQNDPIVRIEAGQLRRALERYYLTSGASDALVITIPKGHYVPTFLYREPLPALVDEEPTLVPELPDLPPKERPRYTLVLFAVVIVGLVSVGFVYYQQAQNQVRPVRSFELPQVLVEKFEDLNGTEASASVASGLTQEIIAQLSLFRDISVIVSGAPKVPETDVSPRYALGGSINLTPAGFRLRVRLVQRPDGAVLWSKTYDGDLTVAPLVQAQTDIAENVAMNLAQSSGVILRAAASEKRDLPAADWEAYSCILTFQSFRATLNREVIPEMKQCLETTVARFPDYSTAWALLALTELDQLRSMFPRDPEASATALNIIFSHARRAIDLDPHNVRGLEAEMLALYWDGQFAQGKIVGDRAVALNPNDTELLAEFGHRLALSGDWDAGCPMVQKAYAQDLVRIMYNNPALALCSYMKGDLAEAAAHVSKTTAPSHPLHMLIAATIHGEAGNTAEADRYRVKLLEVAPDLVENVRDEVALRIRRPEDVERILQSLAKAGFKATSSKADR